MVPLVTPSEGGGAGARPEAADDDGEVIILVR
jgi:hypothetical protein